MYLPKNKSLAMNAKEFTWSLALSKFFLVHVNILLKELYIIVMETEEDLSTLMFVIIAPSDR